jgi:hypothetical protein
MKQYIKNGKIKKKNQIIIHKNGKQIINPNESYLIEDGWIEYVIPKVNEVVSEKNHKLFEINRVYNDSKGFYMNDTYCTFDTETLNKMLLRVMAESAMKFNKTTLWFNGNAYPMKTKDALELLYNLQIYYGNCFDISESHKQNVDKLETSEDIKNYNCEDNYPEKLKFNI